MNVWRVQNDSKYAAVVYKIGDSKFNGLPLKSAWVEPDIRYNFDLNREAGLIIPDFPFISSGALLASDRAVETFPEEVVGDVELLPVKVVGYQNSEFLSTADLSSHYHWRNYRVLNPIKIIDALDKSRSEIEYMRLRDGRQIPMRIAHYSFFDAILGDANLFKIPEFTKTEIFATDLFYEYYLDSELSGLDFTKIY